MPKDINERTYQFALQVVEFCLGLPNTVVSRTLAKQLLRAGTSIGANVEEANSAHSHDDFVYKMGIALREARQTHYWLRLICDSRLTKSEKVAGLIDEGEQLKKILGAITSKARGKSKPKQGVSR